MSSSPTGYFLPTLCLLPFVTPPTFDSHRLSLIESRQIQDVTGCHVAIQKAHEVTPGIHTRRVTISGGQAAHRQHCAGLIRQKVSQDAAAIDAAKKES